MPFWSDINSTYLDEAVKRLTQMIEVATPDPVQVIDYFDPALTPPYWSLYPGLVAPTELAYDLSTQTYEVMARYVVAHSTEGYDGNNARKLWVLLPTVINYINGHKRLQFKDKDGNEMYASTVSPLDTDKTRARQASGFGIFPQTTIIGIEIAISLSFNVLIEQEW